MRMTNMRQNVSRETFSEGPAGRTRCADEKAGGTKKPTGRAACADEKAGDAQGAAARNAVPASVDEPFLEVAYTYDGTLEGLLSAVFAAYAHREIPTDIAPATALQPRLGQRVAEVPTCTEHALRVQQGICRTCGAAAFDTVKTASLSDDPQTGTIVYRFIRHAMATCAPRGAGGRKDARLAKGAESRRRTRAARNVLSDITHPAVEPFVRLARAVGNERHRMMQFLRFEHLEGNVWFARCAPKANVVPLLMDWFAERFNTQPFIIYDEAHRIAGVYAGDDWHLVKTDALNLPDRAADERTMQQAWKRFYKTVAVESRYNPELRRQFMPKRLWENITEMQEELPDGNPESNGTGTNARTLKENGRLSLQSLPC